MSAAIPRPLNPPAWVLHGIRFVVGAIFIYAGAAKWVGPQDFAKAIDSFHLLPPVLVSALAITLPALEILAGGLWVLNRFAKVGAASILLLCFVFLIALAVAVTRGISAECGCFGTLFGESLPGALVRDVILCAATAYWLASKSRDVAFDG